MFNFATASVSRDELSQKLEALQNDAMKFFDEGGMRRFNAEGKWRGEAAALIRESVIDTFRMTDPTPMWTERREGQHGDTYEFEQLINTLRVVEYSPQSLPTTFTPRKAKHTISTSSYELSWGIPLQKIMNRQHTLGEFVSMAAEALVRHYATMTMTAIDTACASGNVDMKNRPLRTMAGASDVTKTELDAALRRMYSTNSGLTIFGSRYALDAIYSFAGAQSEALKDELNSRGVVGQYRGAKMVEFVDDHNLFYNAFTKVNGVDLEKLIFISSGSPGAVLLEKDMSGLDWEDLDVRGAQWSQGARFESGILVHTASKYHVIQLA